MKREAFELIDSQIFELAYGACAKGLGCDAVGSVQYNRMIELWTEQGRPRPIDIFILVQANATRDREDDATSGSEDETILEWSEAFAETC